MTRKKEASNDFKRRRGRRVAQRRSQPAAADVDRAAALEKATRQYIDAGYEMTEFTNFAVRLRGPRRLRWLPALVLAPLFSAIVWMLTERAVLAYSAGATTLLIIVIWNTVMKPHHSIVLGVDESGKVTKMDS
jgi:hypothetical protein